MNSSPEQTSMASTLWAKGREFEGIEKLLDGGIKEDMSIKTPTTENMREFS